MRKSLILGSIAALAMALPSLVSASTISEDAIIVGNGSTSLSGLTTTIYPTGTVTAYSVADQTELLSFTAYARKYGVQVATGDVTGDGVMDIVTMPFRAVDRPEWKVFDLSGNLEASGVVPRQGLTLLKQYNIVVGDVTGDDQAEIILTNSRGNRILIDVLTLNNGGNAHRVAQYNEVGVNNYTRGAWVELMGTDIVTAPVIGDGVVDVWSVAGDTITSVASYTVENSDGSATSGLHIAGGDASVLAVEHSTGRLHLLVWDDTNLIFAEGPLETLTSDFTIGKIGNIAWLGSGTYAYSDFTSNSVTYHDYNAMDGGTGTVSFDVDSKGSFVDFVTF